MLTSIFELSRKIESCEFWHIKFSSYWTILHGYWKRTYYWNIYIMKDNCTCHYCPKCEIIVSNWSILETWLTNLVLSKHVRFSNEKFIQGNITLIPKIFWGTIAQQCFTLLIFFCNFLEQSIILPLSVRYHFFSRNWGIYKTEVRTEISRRIYNASSSS